MHLLSSFHNDLKLKFSFFILFFSKISNIVLVTENYKKELRSLAQLLKNEELDHVGEIVSNAI